MNDVQVHRQVKNVSEQLLNLVIMPSSALKADEIMPELDNISAHEASVE